MKFKLMIFIGYLPFHSALAQMNQEENIYLNMTEYVHVTLDLRMKKDYLNLLESKDAISKEELKRKQDIILCSQALFHSQYDEFLKGYKYQLSTKTINHLSEEKEELERRLRQERPTCEDEELDSYIQEVMKSILFSSNNE
jgi:hypothetical protein